MRQFFSEIYRRGLIAAATAYLVSAWALAKIGELASGRFAAPEWVLQAVLIALAAGFPVVLLISWFFDFKALELSFEETDEDMAKPGAVLSAAMALESKPDKNSIAVLPFANMSADPENEFFADGLAEELLNLLAGIGELKVTARTSSFAFKDKNEDIREICKQLNVAHILEGSVRKSDSAVRITAQLIQAKDGYHLWSETYDRLLDDVFSVQDEISAAITEALKVRILGSKPKARATDPVGYALYLKGKQLMGVIGAESLRAAEDCLKQSLALDANYAPAIVALASCRSAQMSALLLAPEEGIPATRELIERARLIEPDSPQLMAFSAAFAAMFESNWALAQADSDAALAHGMGDARVLARISVAYRYLGLKEKALQVARKAADIDPLNFSALQGLSSSLALNGHFDEARQVILKAAKLFDSSTFCGYHQGIISLLEGKPKQALEDVASETDEFRRREVEMMAQFALGRETKARQGLDQMFIEFGEDAAYNHARVLAFAGLFDEATEWLHRAKRAGDPGLNTMLCDPVTESLRSQENWPALREALGLPDVSA
ncbi:MAG: hypothetical protein ABJ013_10375 [Halioglobus sp.]